MGGAATLGMSLYNPSDAARPDNTGRVLFRYALHSDIDLGRRLSIRYAARPDNSGSAPLRYALHTELSLLDDLVSFGLDGTFFTDRETRPLAPSELDLAPEINLHRAPYELHVAYERDMPLGSDAPDESALAAPQRGLVQSFVYALVVWSFDLGHHSATESLEERTQVPSP